jgi:tellurite resistance protein TerC
MYVFGAFLVITGFRLAFKKDDDIHPEHNPVLKLFRRIIPAVKDYREGHFFVKEAGRWLATPLLFFVIVIEATDVMFAVDSVPAVFAVTTDTFVVYTSNIFAILGLRSLYFLLASYLNRFSYLNYGLAGVLVFVGIKMLIVDWYKVPIPLSLAIITLLIGGAIVVSVLKTRRDEGSAT